VCSVYFLYVGADCCAADVESCCDLFVGYFRFGDEELEDLVTAGSCAGAGGVFSFAK